MCLRSVLVRSHYTSRLAIILIPSSWSIDDRSCTCMTVIIGGSVEKTEYWEPRKIIPNSSPIIYCSSSSQRHITAPLQLSVNQSMLFSWKYFFMPRRRRLFRGIATGSPNWMNSVRLRVISPGQTRGTVIFLFRARTSRTTIRVHPSNTDSSIATNYVTVYTNSP